MSGSVGNAKVWDGSAWQPAVGYDTGGGGGSGVIPFVSVATAFRSSAGTSLIVNRPSGVSSGMLLLAHIGTFDVTSFIATGWTTLRDDGTTGVAQSHLVYKIAGGSEPSTYTFTWTNSRYAVGAISCYDLVDGSDPIAGHSGQTQSSNSITVATLTPDSTAARVLFFATIRSEGRNIQMLARYKVNSSGGTTNGMCIAMSDLVWPGATPTGIIVTTADGGGGSNSNAGQLVAINPV
jgi:hypothetical protein